MAAHENTATRINFTKARVDRFACPPGKGQAFLWDSSVSGLGLRATKGAKTFIFQARLNGRTLRLRIGSHDGWDIDNARAEARRLRVLVDSGIHPRDERVEREQAAEKAREEQERGTVTLADVWPEYIEARRNDWSESHLADHIKAMQAPGLKRKRSKKTTKAGALYALRGERLVVLTPDRLMAWLEVEKQVRPAVAARAYRLLRACLVWCSEQPRYRGLLDIDILLSSTVRRAVPKIQTKVDVLQREQLKIWFEAVRNIGNPVISAYLQSLLITGARREEMARLRWLDVDFQWRSLVIRDKVEGERIIPLTPYLAALLSCLPRRNEWVFSSPSAAAGRLADANHAHTRTLMATELPHVTLHGLRRSFGTLAEWTEAPVGVVAQIMGHKPSALAEKHYRRRPLDLLRLWHTKIEAWMLEQAGIEQPANHQLDQLREVQ